MASVGDRYVMTLRSKNTATDPAGANPFFNVFAYEATSGSPSAVDMWTGWDAVHSTALCGVLAAATEFDQVYVINLDDPVDYAIIPIALVGSVTGEFLSDFVGWEFGYIRAVRGIHNGRKTFSIVAESSVINGNPTIGAVGDLNGLATSLGLNYNSPNANYTPRIWRRAGTYKVGGVPTPFPDTFYPISGVVFNKLSTQNSRKR